jgi:hypothetical protein
MYEYLQLEQITEKLLHKFSSSSTKAILILIYVKSYLFYNSNLQEQLPLALKGDLWQIYHVLETFPVESYTA